MDGVDFGFEWFSQDGQVSMREEDWETVAGLLKHLQLNVDEKDAEIGRLQGKLISTNDILINANDQILQLRAEVQNVTQELKGWAAP